MSSTSALTFCVFSGFLKKSTRSFWVVIESIAWPISSNFLAAPARQTRRSILEVWAHHSNSFALSFSSVSPGGMGAESDSESILIRGANDSMAASFTAH